MPHAFECDKRPARRHLASVHRRHTQRFVVGLEGADALGFQEISDIPHDVEETGDRGTGISGQEMNTALGLERSFNKELVTGENLPAAFSQEARIGCH
jgi:hypothetical protein